MYLSDFKIFVDTFPPPLLYRQIRRYIFMVLFSPNLFTKRFGEKEGFPPPEVVGSSWKKFNQKPQKGGNPTSCFANHYAIFC